MKDSIAETQTREQWYVTTDFFCNDGKFIKGLGPWPTREEAMACRYGYEQGSGQEGRFYVDQWWDTQIE